MHSPIKLSTGRIVYHRMMDNGATEAYLENDQYMTNEEWSEYIGIINKGL